MSKELDRCKRCDKQLDYSKSQWTATDIESLLETLPLEQKELRSKLLGMDSIDPLEVSRILSESFRTDSVQRQTDGKFAKQPEQAKDSLESNEGKDTLDMRSQNESFILLSSSQIHPSVLNSEMMRLTLSTQKEQSQQSMAGPAAQLQSPAETNGQRDDIADTLEVIGKVADKLDDRTIIEHPMCESCAEALLLVLDRDISDCVRERQILEDIGKAAELIEPLSSQNGSSIQAMQQELDKQEELEQALSETLGILDEQLDALCGQIDELATNEQKEQACRNQKAQEQNQSSLVLERLEAEQWALDEKYARLAAQLTQLQRTNVYNDVFNITVSDGVASINGFRLGGRSTHNVEWAEINTAWGQSLLLLQTVARKLEYEFVGYRLIPMGAFSRIERLSEEGVGVTLELFGSGDLYLGRLFQSRRFDAAMVAFLACLDQIAQLIMSINPQLRLPYRIDQDRVGAVSIKPQFGQDELWTRACRNTLMDARWALAFVSSYNLE
ncbi:autophagy protein [Coemansia sp. RSA 2336]|nr:autophagy protein [Coemansia sp. RSA 2336]